jgi:hypothetical protein
MIDIRNLQKTYRRGQEVVIACEVEALSINAGEQVARSA